MNTMYEVGDILYSKDKPDLEVKILTIGENSLFIKKSNGDETIIHKNEIPAFWCVKSCVYVLLRDKSGTNRQIKLVDRGINLTGKEIILRSKTGAAGLFKVQNVSNKAFAGCVWEHSAHLVSTEELETI